ncbi:MAG: hypothetical protein UX89_C0003G0050 [Parcubacteria group bacterium GW2011_GWA2_47_16]|nr:MAG: hypothetical protein UX89_C0003G0050 [Parcubacteria group bacterium GW2011_GWA2_47_16]
MKKIAVIGTGIMGHGMAANFLKHGFEVIVWNRDKKKLKLLVQKGAVVAVTPREAAAKADTVFEVTANDESSRSVWLGDDGILSGAHKNITMIASGTFSVSWIDELARVCAERKTTFFDMPLTGSRMGAEGGTLTLLVGGKKAKLQKLKPILKNISRQVVYFGKAGSGTRFKLILNSLAAIHIVAFGEMLRIAKSSGLDIKKVGDFLAEKPGGTSTKLAWQCFNKPPKPINFFLRWIAKDLTYAKALSDSLPTPLLDEVLKKYRQAIDRGIGEEDWTIINR